MPAALPAHRRRSLSFLLLPFFAIAFLCLGRMALADDPPIDWDRARTLYQREQRGDQLTPEEHAYLERARDERRKAGAATQPADRIGDIDLNRARTLYQKSQRGEPLTDEERQYVERAKAVVQQRQQQQASERPAITGQPFTNLIPLTQLKAKYKGFDGGLYGTGKNEPPEALAKVAKSVAESITPLDADGKPAPDGKFVLMSIGMSNTTQEFSQFKRLADRDSEKSPKLLIVDAAQGGKDAAAWTNGADKAGPFQNPVWEEADHRLALAHVTPRQVGVVWIKQALIRQGQYGEFPAHAQVLQRHLEKILQLAKSRYPNLRLAYMSSRIYAGYAMTQLNPEPYAYEGAFSIRWVIEKQLQGDPSLNHDSAKGAVKSPLVLWGPYLWTNGAKGRDLDDVVFTRDDLAGDGTHPSASGQQKVAQMLLKFFKTDSTAKVWFVKP
jgi:hypothetical protein